MDRLTSSATVFARVEPRQKLDIVQSLQRGGHYVAVSGDIFNRFGDPGASLFQFSGLFGKHIVDRHIMTCLQ